MPAAQNPYGSSPGLSQSDAGSEQVHNFFDFTDDFYRYFHSRCMNMAGDLLINRSNSDSSARNYRWIEWMESNRMKPVSYQARNRAS